MKFNSKTHSVVNVSVCVCVNLYIVHVTYVPVHALQISFSFNRYALK